jgi:hypothetical protein
MNQILTQIHEYLFRDIEAVKVDSENISNSRFYFMAVVGTGLIVAMEVLFH